MTGEQNERKTRRQCVGSLLHPLCSFISARDIDIYRVVQEDGQAQIRFNDMRRESGLKMMKMVFKKLKNAVLIGALASMRRNQAVDQGGDALAQVERPQPTNPAGSMLCVVSS